MEYMTSLTVQYAERAEMLGCRPPAMQTDHKRR